ncbi:unnamed protein product, partial [Symbiodinium microadriaticum]
YGALALANMALSPSQEIVQVFASKGLLDKVIKMGVRQEIETQREVTALIRNLSCHAHLRHILIERRVVGAVRAAESSVFPEVVEWASEILRLMEKDMMDSEMAGRTNPLSKGSEIMSSRVLHRVSSTSQDMLAKMTPLEGSVTWSTWGSKLESIFSPIFATLPTLQGIQVYTHINSPLDIYLAKGLSKGANKWRDSMTYVIMERPSHGKLNEYSTSSDYITYTPRR